MDDWNLTRETLKYISDCIQRHCMLLKLQYDQDKRVFYGNIGEITFRFNTYGGAVINDVAIENDSAAIQFAEGVRAVFDYQDRFRAGPKQVGETVEKRKALSDLLGRWQYEKYVAEKAAREREERRVNELCGLSRAGAAERSEA